MVTSSAQLTASWTITPNLHNTPFVSLNDSAAYFIFQNFSAMTAGGATIKWTCDGVTGPTSAGDTTNRLLTKANCTIQGAAAGNAQCFFVVTNTDGAQLGIFYQGATADVIRIGYSPGGIYVLAGTSNQQPTATDEVPISVGNSIIGATASADRVLQIWTTTGCKNWSCAIFRQNAIVNVLGIERVNDICSTGVFAPLPYIGYRLTVTFRTAAFGTPVGGITTTAVGVTGNVGVMARIFTASTSRLVRLGGGDITLAPPPGSNTAITADFNSTPPATSSPGGGTPFFPIFWSGEKAANLDGFIGYPIDWYIQYTSNSATTPALGTFSPGYDLGDTPGVSPASPRTNWFVALGGAMWRPWKNAAAAMDIA